MRMQLYLSSKSKKAVLSITRGLGCVGWFLSVPFLSLLVAIPIMLTPSMTREISVMESTFAIQICFNATTAFWTNSLV